MRTRGFPAFGARRGLGDASGFVTALESLIPFAGAVNAGQQAENTYYALRPASAENDAVPISWANVTGHLTQAQSDALVSQEVQELVQAGMDPAAAQAQAQANVNWSLNQAGAAPLSLFQALGAKLPAWVWLAAIGAAIVLIYES